MQATLTINGVNFSSWAKEGGITQNQIERQGREVITLNGTRYYTSVKKRAISFTAVELRDETLLNLMAALSTNPAEVNYTDLKWGDNWTSNFYITNISAAEKVVTGGNTYWTGFGFELEER